MLEARGEVARTAAILRYHAQAALDPDGETFPSGDGRSLLMARRRPRGVVGLITPWNFPHRHPCLEARARARLRQRVRVEALAVLARLRRGAARVPRARAARAGRADGAGPRRRRRRARRPPRRARDLVHRLGARPGTPSPGWRSSAAPPPSARWAARTRRSCSPTPTSRRPPRRSRRRRWATPARSAPPPAASSASGAIAGGMRDALVAAVEGLRIEDPADEACRVGPLISADARDAGAAAVKRGVDAGGRLLAGGAVLDAPGNYLTPALVEVDDPSAELAQEEVFAPVCARHARRRGGRGARARKRRPPWPRHRRIHPRPRPRRSTWPTASIPASCA